jgi:predicted patatin/cPLA2 family phospholipase
MAVSLAGCASRPQAVPAHLDNPPPWGAFGTIEHPDDTAPGHTHAGPPPDILALSGGASEGAFAAGLLCGWTQAGDRPEFDIVTGISAGALAATFAFLGLEYDPILRESFTRVSSHDVYFWYKAFSAPVSDSVVDKTPLRDRIDAAITPQILDAVAREHARGRRLYVASYNLDARKPVIWDLGAIASSDEPRRRERYRDALLASAAIPTLFPPVYIPVEIDGQTYWQMHVDGGVHGMVFLHDFLLETIDAGQGGNVYALLNTKYPRTGYRTGVPPNSIKIGIEAAEAYFLTHTLLCLRELQRLCKDRQMVLRLAWIPLSLRMDAPRTRFDKEEMGRIFQHAFDAAEAGFKWETSVPSLKADILPLAQSGN